MFHHDQHIHSFSYQLLNTGPTNADFLSLVIVKQSLRCDTKLLACAEKLTEHAA